VPSLDVLASGGGHPAGLPGPGRDEVLAGVVLLLTLGILSGRFLDDMIWG
jgi:hypothetical protein